MTEWTFVLALMQHWEDEDAWAFCIARTEPGAPACAGFRQPNGCVRWRSLAFPTGRKVAVHHQQQGLPQTRWVAPSPWSGAGLDGRWFSDARHGPGIAPEHRLRLIGRFYRADAAAP